MLNLMLAGNDRVFDGALLVSLSLLRHTDRAVHLFLLTMDLREYNPDFAPLTSAHAAFLERLYRAKNPDSRVTLLDVGGCYRAALLASPNAQTEYTPYTFLRLFADRIPQIPDRVLYVDTDVIFQSDPSALYDTDLSGCELAGVLDYYGHIFLGRGYLNAGVLLLNMARIRQTGLFAETVELCAAQKLFLPDQTALNRLVTEKRVLPRRFNEQKRYRPDTVVRHYAKTIRWFPWFHTRNVKPWQPERMHKLLHDTRCDGLYPDFERLRDEFARETAPAPASKPEQTPISDRTPVHADSALA